MKLPEHLQLATAHFRRRIEDAQRALGPQDFPWYPYDTFGSARPLDALLLPDAVEGLRKLAGGQHVLDIGCGDGALAFFLESLGCKVDAVDYPPANHNGMRGIRRLKEALGSAVEIHAMDLDEAFALPQPLYGLTLFLGVLYHLKNPFGVLEALAEHSQFCLLSTRIAQNSPRGARMSDEALAYLAGEYELNADESNFWIFSETGLRRLLERTGWRVRGAVTSGVEAGSEPVRPDRDQRATCLIESLRAPRRDAPELLAGWYGDEGGWRWTAPDFSVRMASHPLDPAGGIEFHFSIPGHVLEQIGPITLRARIARQDLGAQTYREAGQHQYTAALPSGVAAGGGVQIDFAVSPAYQPPSPDRRELGVQVTFQRTGPTRKPFLTHPLRLIPYLPGGHNS